MAIVTSKTDQDALSFATISLIIAAVIATIFQVILLVGGENLLLSLNLLELGIFVYALPIALWFVGLQDVCDYTAARMGEFKSVARVSVFSALITNVARVVGGLFSPIAAILILVTTFSPAVYSAFLLKSLKEWPFAPFRLQSDQAYKLLRNNLDFPLYRMPTDVINAASQSTPVILLAYFYSPAEAGLYVLARSVINLPISVVGTALGNVYYAKFADLHRDNKPIFPILFRATVLQLFIPGLFLLIATLFFPILFSLVFGEQWRIAGEYAQWMALWAIGMLVNVPSVRALPVINQQAWHLFFNAMIFIGGVFGIYVGYNPGESSESAVMWYSIFTALLYSGQILFYLWLAYRFDKSVRTD